ncbi:hypothetical protein CR513_17407, partial [Mucuna pruriens]
MLLSQKEGRKSIQDKAFTVVIQALNHRTQEGASTLETYEFTDDALVDEDGNGDAEDANKGEVAASPTEIELEILSSSAPILYELILVCFHSSSHIDY